MRGVKKILFCKLRLRQHFICVLYGSLAARPKVAKAQIFNNLKQVHCGSLSALDGQRKSGL